VQVIGNENAAGYISKEIGKTSHIEEALKRAKRGEEKKSDIKKLFAHFVSKHLRIRRWGVSRDLIRYMNNPSEEAPEKEKPEYLIIPRSMVRSSYFEPFTQVLDKNTELYRKLNNYFDEMMTLCKERRIK